MSAQYDIILNRNENFILYMDYLGENDVPVNLGATLANNTPEGTPEYYAKMAIKRFKRDSVASVILKSNPYEILVGLTGTELCGPTGGIKLNRNSDDTGGQTGGIYIMMNAFASMSLPPGKSFYDIFLVKSGSSIKLLEGAIDIAQEVTTSKNGVGLDSSSVFSDEIDGGSFC